MIYKMQWHNLWASCFLQLLSLAHGRRSVQRSCFLQLLSLAHVRRSVQRCDRITGGCRQCHLQGDEYAAMRELKVYFLLAAGFSLTQISTGFPSVSRRPKSGDRIIQCNGVRIKAEIPLCVRYIHPPIHTWYSSLCFLDSGSWSICRQIEVCVSILCLRLMGNLLDNRRRCEGSDQMTSWRHFSSVDKTLSRQASCWFFIRNTHEISRTLRLMRDGISFDQMLPK
jgi:hypothetical protein